jgi:hypothetical protein
MQSDGNLVEYNLAGEAVWHTGTYGNPGAYLVMQGDGNLVLYRSDGAALWYTWTFVSGSTLRLDTSNNGNLYVLSCCASPPYKVWNNGVNIAPGGAGNSIVWEDWDTLVCGEICYWASGVDVHSTVSVSGQNAQYNRLMYRGWYYARIYDGSASMMRVLPYATHNHYGSTTDEFGSSNYSCISGGDFYTCRKGSVSWHWWEYSPPSNHWLAGRFYVYSDNPMVAPSFYNPDYPVVY